MVQSLSEVVCYKNAGFVFPCRVLTENEASDLCANLERHEASTGAPIHNNLRHKSHLLFTWLRDVVQHAGILDIVEQLIGPNILCWSSTFFIKEPGQGRVEWHRDSDYISSGQGLEPAELLTVWLALSRVSRQSGAVEFLPGSHLDLSITTASPSTIADLQLGEVSIHHCNLLHKSGINASSERRIAFAIRYIPAHVRQTERMNSAMLVRGTDANHSFPREAPPMCSMSEQARDQHKRAVFMMLGKSNK
jgi:hypothetical protein